MTTEIYTPHGCTTLDKLEEGQIRIGIQGPPFSGKTTASLTFPNPAIISFDRKVSAHGHRTDVINIPFYDPEFVNRIQPKAGLQAPVNRKEALIKWLNSEAVKLSPSQTLVLDGSTAIEEAYHIWFRFNEDVLATTKTGGRNEFIEWRLKNDYFGEITTALKSVPCHVVYICHETPDRDKKGELNGKIRPLLTGQFGDKLAGNFTDWFRAIVLAKPINREQREKAKEWASIDDATLNEWIASTPPIHQSIYLWQTQEDQLCDCGTSSLFNCPKYILASYQSFLKYRKPSKPITV